MRFRWTLLAIAAAAVGGCGSDAKEPAEIGTADAYVAIVEWELGDMGPPTTDESLPVVYIASEDGTIIDAGAQAKVVQATVDRAKVRFTDVRDDAIDEEVEGAPVKDGGVMLIVENFDGEGSSRLEVPVAVYRTEHDQRETTLTLVADAQGVSVTAATPRPAG